MRQVAPILLALAAVASAQTPKESDELRHLRELCERGVAVNCAELGRRLVRGEGVARDFARAAVLLDKACSANVVGACSILGWLYEAGDGWAKDGARGAA